MVSGGIGVVGAALVALDVEGPAAALAGNVLRAAHHQALALCVAPSRVHLDLPREDAPPRLS